MHPIGCYLKSIAVTNFSDISEKMAIIFYFLEKVRFALKTWCCFRLGVIKCKRCWRKISKDVLRPSVHLNKSLISRSHQNKRSAVIQIGLDTKLDQITYFWFVLPMLPFLHFLRAKWWSYCDLRFRNSRTVLTDFRQKRSL